MNTRNSLFLKKISICIVVSLAAIFFVFPPPLHSQEAEKRFIILADVSGSMTWNDSLDLRKDALRFFVNTVAEANPENLELAFYSFGETTYPHKPENEIFFSPNKNSQWLSSEIEGLPRNDRYTDLSHSLETIYRQVSTAAFAGKTYLFLFTDAELTQDDVPRGVDLARYKQQMYGVAADLGDKNVIIYALAFSDKANLDYLMKLVSYTGGKAYQARRVHEANQTILDLIERIIKKPAARNFDIPVDKTIKAFTVYGFIPEADKELPRISVFNPGGEKINLPEKKYRTSIAVTCNDPEPGKWRAEVQGAQGGDIVYTYRTRFEVVHHRPQAKEFYMASGTPIDVDMEIVNIDDASLKDFRAQVSFQTGGSPVKTYPLERDNRRFKGSITDILKPGLYTMRTTVITSNGDEVNDEFMMTIGPSVDLDCTVKSDIGLKSKVIVSASKPGEFEKIKAATVHVIDPKRRDKEYKLYDDGDDGRGDEIAGDMKYSGIVDSFPEPGLYVFEVIVDGLRNGSPVKARKAIQVLKALSVKAVKSKITYSRNPAWAISGALRLKNHIGYPVQITGASVESSGVGVSASLTRETGQIIEPNSEAEMIVEYRHSGEQLPGAFEIPLKLNCRVIGVENAGESTVRLTQGFAIKPSVGSVLIKLMLTLAIILAVLIILGPTVVVPLRFGDKQVFLRGTTYTLIKQRKHWYSSYVDLDDGEKVGIKLFGYLCWEYHTRDNGIVQNLENIDIIPK